mgnify:CR=1 FL=1
MTRCSRPAAVGRSVSSSNQRCIVARCDGVSFGARVATAGFVARFDVVQQQDDPCRFVLVEAYRTESAPADHKATPHYATWRDTVASMMAVPRQSVRYHSVHLPD